MATPITQILTIKVNGVEQSIDSVEGLVQAQQQLNAEIAKVEKGTREYTQLNKELAKVDKQLSEVAASAKQASDAGGKGGSGIGRAFQGAKDGIGKAVQGFGALRLAIAATGIGALVQIVIQLVQYFSRFDTVADFVEKTSRQVAAAFTKIFEAGKALLSLDIEGFGKQLLGIADAVKNAGDLADQLDELNDRIRDFRLEQAKGQKELEKLLLQAKDRGKAEEERLKLLQQAADLESALNARNLEFLRKQAQFAEQEAKDQGVIFREVQGRLELEGERQDLIDAYIEAQVALTNAERESGNVQERINNRRSALLEELRAEEEKQRLAREEARKKELDAQLAQFQAEKALEQSRIALRTDTEAEIQRAAIARDLALEELRIKELKGEKVLAEQRLKIQQDFENAVATARAAETKRQEEENAKRSEAFRRSLETIAKLNEEDLKRQAEDQNSTIGQRIAAEQELARVTIARLEEERALKLKNVNLSAEEIAAINATYDAQVAGIERATGAATKSLNELGSPILTAVFGDLTEQQVKDIEANLQTIADTALNVGQQLFDSYVQGLQASAEEAAAIAQEQEAKAQELAQSTADLKQRLTTADLSQRSAIIAQIKQQQRAQAAADAAAAKARSEERALKREAAVAQRNADIVQATVNGALAVVRALSIDPTGILAAINGALAAVQIGIIASQPLPQFARGGYTGEGSGAPDSSGFRPAGIVHEGEYVVPKSVLQRPAAQPLVGALENMRMGSYANGGMVGGSTSLDTSGLAQQIAASLAAMPAPVVDITELSRRQFNLIRARESVRL